MARVREAMIVAGGQGTRLRPLTLTTPKPLLPVCGRPFLSGVIRKLAAVGVQRALLVVGADTSPFRALEGDAAEVGVSVELVPEPSPLDTAGGVRAALDRVTGTFLVLNGDILTGLDLGHLLREHARSGAMASLALTRVDDTSAYGVCVLDGSRIVDFVEKPAPGTLPGQDAVNAGTYVLEPQAMARFPTGPLSFERHVFPELVAAGEPVHGIVSEAVWADLGTPERFLEGHRLILDGHVDWPAPDGSMRSPQSDRTGMDIVIADSAELHAPMQVGPGTRVGAGALVGSHVVVGAGALIAEHVSLQGSVLFDGCRIQTGASITGAIVGHGVTIGAGAVVEQGAVIGDGQQVPDGERVPPARRVPPTDESPRG